MPEAVIPKLDSLSIPARAFAQLFAFLAPSPIMRGWCVGSREQAFIAEALKDLGSVGAPSSEAEVTRAIDELAAQALVRVSEQSILFDAESLDAVRVRIPKEQQRVWVERALQMVDRWTPENTDDATTWKLMADLEPHITRVLEFAEAEKIPHPTGVLMGQKLGVYLFVTGKVARSEQLIRRGLQLDEAHFGPNHSHVAVDVNNLAFLLDGAGRGAETEPLKIRVVEILMQHQEAEPEKFATALTNLAAMFRNQGRLVEAEGLYRQAIEVGERRLGPEHRTLARDLRNLGGFLTRSNRFAEAEDLLRRALAIDEKALGANHPAVASDLQLLASVLSKQNKLEGLDRLHQRAVEIDAQWHPAHSPEVLHDLLGLANTFELQGQIDKAVSTWQQVIQNCEDRELTDSFPLIFALFKLATAWMEKNDFAAAVALLRRSLAMAEVKFGRNDAQTRLIRQTLLDSLTRQGNFDEARTLALNLREEELRRKVETNPRDTAALNEYGLFLKNERNDFAGAERCYRKAIELTPNDAIVIANLAVLLTTVFAKHEEAEKLYRRALEISPTDASILGNFANLVHNALRKYDEAAQLYQMSLQRKPGDAAVLANYAMLLVQQGALGEAASHVDQAWKLQSGRHDRISARILFVKATIETLQARSPDLFLGQLKTLFRQGISHAARVVGVIVEHLREKLPPSDFVLFGTIARTIGDKAVLPELESIGKWKTLKEEKLDAPWETVTEI